ncbi:hypothetical protein OUZ56_027586 [Daphnia magna]|uniref:Uncharacterized protein n=1 Tax=Daphnia magna TaxID=35525 RepID=A0ABR0B1B8_9CRUS|nr:hypothetical protein OUZ56_027586 [Daphnia magna]
MRLKYWGGELQTWAGALNRTSFFAEFIGVESWIVMVQFLVLQFLTGFSDFGGCQINKVILDKLGMSWTGQQQEVC